MRILFIGDSLVEYFDWQDRFPGHEVYNRGIAGETVEGLLGRLHFVLERTGPLDLVFIMSGINNLAMGDAGFLGTYGEVIRKIASRTPHSRIFIQSLLPVIIPFLDNGEIRRINEDLKKLAEREGVSYLDVHRLFLDASGRPLSPLLLDDGVHLSSRGYEVWSGAVAQVISEA